MAERAGSRNEGTARRREVAALWPALTFHYGITPAELKDTPNWMLRIYADKLPELLARRQLLAIEASVYPHCSDDGQNRIMAALNERIPGSDNDRAPAPQSLDDAKGLAAMSGIGFKVVDKDGNEIPSEGR